MSRGLAWYRPVRLFHRVFAVGVVAVGIITLVLGRESPLFAYHGSIGYALALMVVLRLIIGVVGRLHARSGPPRPRAGGSAVPAYVTSAMLALVLGLGITGAMMYRGVAGVKQLHVLMAYTLFAAAVAHVLAVRLRTSQRRGTLAAVGQSAGHAGPARGLQPGQPR